MHRHLIHLVVRRDGAQLHALDLAPGELSMGRAEDNDLCLADLEVSRYHARIVVTETGARFEDCGSGNGSWLGERQIEALEITDGATITLTPFTLSFRVLTLRLPTTEDTGEATAQLPSELTAEATVRAVVAPAARLVLLSEGRADQDEFPLPPEGVTLGRSPDRDVTLLDTAASRLHAEILAIGGSWWLRDSGASNGTFVGESEVRECPLKNGEIIRIGETRLRFSLDRDPLLDESTEHSDATDSTVPFMGALIDETAPGPDRPVSALPSPPAALAPASLALPELPSGPSAAVADGGFGGVEMAVLSERRPKGFFSKPLNRFSTLLLALLVVGGGGYLLSNPPPPPDDEITISTDQDQHIQRLMSDGMARFQAREYEAATRKFLAVLKLAPAHTGAQRMGYLAAEFITLEAMQAATELGADADQARSDTLREAREAAEAGMSGHLGQVSAGRDAIKAALERYPGVSELEEALTALKARDAALRLGAKDDTIRVLQAEVKGLYEEALAEDSGRNPSAALQAWRRVVSADPDRLTDYYFPATDRIRDLERKAREGASAVYKAGIAAAQAGDFLTARANYQEALRAAPTFAAAQTRLGECQAQLEKLAQSEFNAGRTMETANQVDRALGHYNQVLVLIEDRNNATYQRADQRIKALLQ